MSGFIYRAVDPRNDEDMQKYFALAKNLSNFLKNNAIFDENQMRWARIRMGAVEYVDLNDWVERPLKPIEEEAQEFVFVCEKDGEFVGYVDICDYHMEDNMVKEDEIGAIHEIYVKDEYQRRSENISFKLLQMAVEKLLECGKTHAQMEVQEDNKNRFLHFALAEGNVVKSSVCKRRNGEETKSYILVADLEKIKNLTPTNLIVKTAHMKKKMIKENGLEI